MSIESLEFVYNKFKFQAPKQNIFFAIFRAPHRDKLIRFISDIDDLVK